ncbi:hypothetical protein KSP35_11870 [Aquihabitans sp. G128]|uniref:hypothetical protein n=1 Tax=Aquihabitans sp. G128 TaxID=2849779 RepID=UPI001C21FA27|nr:hypothetical protein [Aquihabitans sp. G128]QXC59112.1 hypothetical protein KSP35_11870 [Aquihabitans sp. G128]
MGMNAERLHALAELTLDDLRSTNLLAYLENLHVALKHLVGNPAEGSYQQSVAQALADLRTSIEASRIDGLPPGDRETLANLNILPCIGSDVMNEIDELFAENQMTPSIVKDHLESIVDRVRQIQTSLEEMASAFAYFGIESEHLDPGDCELSIEIPRDEVQNSLAPLGVELRRLDQILGPFQELATGSRSAVPVKAISTSNFLFTVELDPDTGALIAEALAWITSRYDEVVELREMVERLRGMNLPGEAAAIESKGRARVLDEIPRFVEGLLQDRGVNLRGQGRDNEITTALIGSVRALAKRIDHSYRVRVRALPPEIDPEAAESETTNEVEKSGVFEKIAEFGSQTDYLELHGSPILFELGDGEIEDDESQSASE